MDIISLSQQLLDEVKFKRATVDHEVALYEYDAIVFFEEMSTDEKKKTFWINIYNAFYLILHNRFATNDKNFKKIYSLKKIGIAGWQFSLDEIEHNILRRSSYKYSLGFYKRLISNSLDKKLRVDALDYRIHFALNCGAVSCPPIRFYSPNELNEQLDLATYSFLEKDILIVKNMLYCSRLFLWYYADFGCKKGIIKILKRYGFLTETDKHWRLKFKPYNTNPFLYNFEQ